MSQLDKQLLDTAGYKVPDAVALLRRSRPAIYQGIAAPKNYFSAAEITLLVHDSVRRDSPRTKDLIDFIEAHYPEQCDLILPGHVSCGQLERVAQEAQRVIIGFNGGIEHLAGSSIFSKAASKVFGFGAHNVDIIARDEWVQAYFDEHPSYHPRQVLISNGNTHPSCFFLLVKGNGVRQFLVGKFSLVEEMTQQAEKLLNYLQPMLQLPAAP